MYLTSHRVFLRSTNRRGINSFLYRHDDGPYREIDWANPDVVKVADSLPGRFVAEEREIREPGGEVLSFVDIVAEDGSERARIEAALHQFSEPAILLGSAPFTVIDRVGIRFSALLGLRSDPDRFAQEFEELRLRAIRLLSA